MLTLKAVAVSALLCKLSGFRVSLKAGQGDECSYLALLENSSWSHFTHTYFPET